MSQDLLTIVLKIIAFWLKTGEVSMQKVQKNVSHEKLSGITEDVVEFFFTLIGPERVMNQFKPEDVIQQFKPEEILKGLDVEDIENYLNKLKKAL